jgi:hypothetical protein
VIQNVDNFDNHGTLEATDNKGRGVVLENVTTPAEQPPGETDPKPQVDPLNPH